MSDFVVGLTGGIGSGKSAATSFFAALGIAVVDTDAIAHELTAAGGAAMPALVVEFGPTVTTADGALELTKIEWRGTPAPALPLGAVL